MSLTFKLTIPDGVLAEHLSGRDSKSRNFELIRLATNHLLIVPLVAQPQLLEEVAATIVEKPKVVRSSAKEKHKYSYESVEVDSKRSSNNKLEQDLSETNLDPSEHIVDFGDDLLLMN
jgi:hypothetical protein